MQMWMLAMRNDAAFLALIFCQFVLKIDSISNKIAMKDMQQIVSKTFRHVWNALLALQPFMVAFGKSVFSVSSVLVRRFRGNLTRGATCNCMFDERSSTIIQSRPMITYDVMCTYVYDCTLDTICQCHILYIDGVSYVYIYMAYMMLYSILCSMPYDTTSCYIR